jgi:hypothetical protein
MHLKAQVRDRRMALELFGQIFGRNQNIHLIRK